MCLRSITPFPNTKMDLSLANKQISKCSGYFKLLGKMDYLCSCDLRAAGAEPWFGCNYKRCRINAAMLERWRAKMSSRHSDQLALPPPNTLIPTNFEIVDHGTAANAKHPKVLWEDSDHTWALRLWFKVRTLVIPGMGFDSWCGIKRTLIRLKIGL